MLNYQTLLNELNKAKQQLVKVTQQYKRGLTSVHSVNRLEQKVSSIQKELDAMINEDWV